MTKPLQDALKDVARARAEAKQAEGRFMVRMLANTEGAGRDETQRYEIFDAIYSDMLFAIELLTIGKVEGSTDALREHCATLLKAAANAARGLPYAEKEPPGS